MKPTGLVWYFVLLTLCATLPCAAAPKKARRTHELTARDTLTVVKLNHGDTLQFKLANGQPRTFMLKNTSAQIIEKVRGGIVYSFDCELLADGQPLTLRRFVCSQETFYEPWIVNGVRIWLSSSAAIFKLVPIRYPQDHEAFDADAVLALQDATLPICPQPIQPWFPIEKHFIDVGKCYNGDDPWLGPYLGEACHVGLDINMPKGTSLYAPLDFDDQWIFSADHRWRGVRRWPNGDHWALQSHHVDKLLIPENTSLKAGTHYGEAAGKGIGSHQHSHFEFRVGPDVLNRGHLAGSEVDPWILFWQIFENDKAAKGLIHAQMKPLSPAKTGEEITFSADGSRAGQGARQLDEKYDGTFEWTFGDGDRAGGKTPTHRFSRPGVWPVTLTVNDDVHRATITQHITINGEPSERPAPALASDDDVTFALRPSWATDVYGWPAPPLANTLTVCMSSQPGSSAQRVVQIRNIGGGVLSDWPSPDTYPWLKVEHQRMGNEQCLLLTITNQIDPQTDGLTRVAPRWLQRSAFHVRRVIRPSPTAREIIVDDQDPEFYATPSFWVGHQFLRCPERGHRKRYLTNGSRATPGCIARFTPDLSAGRYEVRLHDETPLRDATAPVRIRHAQGETKLHFNPVKGNSRALGEFDFAEGNSGFVEFQAEGSTGLVVVDALVFRRIDRSAAEK